VAATLPQVQLAAESLFTLPLWSMSLTKWAQVELLLMLHQNQHAMNFKVD
jgi:hypothetical protein